ncbi:MAG: Dyp-type peroxidase [Bifidobacteriaceae bacterium]|jgi:putative iron-dependent peroxidase|nr:Dyp-type peroxidase [Bifidobacteriaceae bacterium]
MNRSDTTEGATVPIDSQPAQDVYKDAGQNVVFLTLALNRRDQAAEREAVAELAGRLPAVLNSMRIRLPEAGLKCAFGLSSQAWDYLYPDAAKPKELEDFQGLQDGAYRMPGTPADLFLHLRAGQQAVLFEIIDQLRQFFAPAATVVDLTEGFRYFEGRAIIGFIDGTEAPAEIDSADYAVIGDEDPGFAGGSYAFAQKWLHDMDFWNGLPVEEQERAVGRRKFTDLELDDDAKAPNAHNVAAKIEWDGEEQKIVRMNVPFSDLGTGATGTYFIGYARHWHVTRDMLRQMLAMGDYLLQFSRIQTGQLFFIPSRPLLDRIADNDL